MTLNEKIALFMIMVVCIVSAIVIVPMKSKLATYESALDNTVDATIMEIDNIKKQISARKDANERDRSTICAKLVPKLKWNVPYKYIQDWTCEVE